VPLNDFEQDIFDALKAKGLDLLPQWGASKYRIDMVAKHPKTPGRFVLAIECDGATYHSGATARDRDRLRQQHLEALGWRFHRIWSTDWFLHRDAEVERAVKAYQDAVATADHQDTTVGVAMERPRRSRGTYRTVPGFQEAQAVPDQGGA
jgi:very-short-patch-repair endonuclease